MNQTKLDFDIKRQKIFTLNDVELDNGLELNVTFIDTQTDLNKAIEWLKFAPTKIGVDIETRGLDPYQHELIMFQFGDEYRQFVIDTRIVDIKSILPYIINDTNIIVGQNLKFEYKFIKHNYNLLIERICDTMVQEKCLYNGRKIKYSLKDLAFRYLNYTADKSIRMRFLEIEDKSFSKDEIIYGAYDVILPILIDKQQQIVIKEQNKRKLINLEHEVVKVLGDVEYKGLYFDSKKWEILYNKNLILFNKAKEPLDKFITDNNVTDFIEKQLDIFDTSTKISIKWTSSKQVISLFNRWITVPKERSKSTGRMEYTVEAKSLKTSLNTSNKNIDAKYKQLIKDYLHFKEYEQRVTTFGIKFFKYINPVTGRLHSNYNQIINTGRMSSSGPNLQNIPSPPEFRACFTAPIDHKIVNSDFSGQENIILANKSLDKDLLSFYEKGNSDMHSFIASKIYKKEYNDYIIAKDKKDKNITLSDDEKQLLKERSIAKAAGFAINYGGNGFTISKNIGISSEQGEYVYDSYFKAFPELRKYFDKVIEETLKQGYILINKLSGRTYELAQYNRMKSIEKIPSKKKEYWRLKSAIGRLALNYPIQGTAGDITKSATVRFRKWLLDNDLHGVVFITNIVHDEINVETPEYLSKKVAKGLEECMLAAGKPWCKTIELKANAVIGDYWAH